MKLNDIWNHYRSDLKSFLHSRVSNPTDVEDLLQEILLKTHNSIDELKNKSSIKPWLFQIANRATIDFYRQQGRDQLNEKAQDIEELWHSEHQPSVTSDLVACIEPFLSELPETSANLLRAVDLDGQSQKLYAEELGISYSTLKSRVKKARTDLRALFEDCCHYNMDQQGNLMDFDKKTNHCNNC